MPKPTKQAILSAIDEVVLAYRINGPRPERDAALKIAEVLGHARDFIAWQFRDEKPQVKKRTDSGIAQLRREEIGKRWRG